MLVRFYENGYLKDLPLLLALFFTLSKAKGLSNTYAT
jgi:hypothetical protein